MTEPQPDPSDIVQGFPQSDELSRARIRQIAALRRATYRSRSHALIAAAVCIGIALQLGWMGLKSIRTSGLSARGGVLVICMLGLLFAAGWFIRRALLREAKQTSPHRA